MPRVYDDHFVFEVGRRPILKHSVEEKIQVGLDFCDVVPLDVLENTVQNVQVCNLAPIPCLNGLHKHHTK